MTRKEQQTPPSQRMAKLALNVSHNLPRNSYVEIQFFNELTQDELQQLLEAEDYEYEHYDLHDDIYHRQGCLTSTWLQQMD